MPRLSAQLTRSTQAVVLVAVAVVVLTGCAGTPEGEDEPASEPGVSSSEVASRYGYDANVATLTPTFAIVPEYRDPRDSYARLLLAQDCLRGVLTYQVEPPPPASEADVFDQRTGDRRFTVAIAQRWGYQIPPAPPASTSEESDSGLSSEEVDRRRAECGDATRERLGVPPERLLNDTVDAGWMAVDGDAAVRAATAEWNRCMGPAGVVDLPDGPFDMPSPSVGGETGSPETTAAPSEREREVATLDAECRESVGFTNAVFRARADAELAGIGRDIEGFESVRQEFAEYSIGIQQVIEELG